MTSKIHGAFSTSLEVCKKDQVMTPQIKSAYWHKIHTKYQGNMRRKGWNSENYSRRWSQVNHWAPCLLHSSWPQRTQSCRTCTQPYTIIMIIITALKGTIWDFFTISSLCREPSPTCTLKWPGRNHEQHFERISRAACRFTCDMVRRDSSAIKFDRVEITFISAFILLAEPLTNERGEETRVPGENP